MFVNRNFAWNTSDDFRFVQQCINQTFYLARPYDLNRLVFSGICTYNTQSRVKYLKTFLQQQRSTASSQASYACDFWEKNLFLFFFSLIIGSIEQYVFHFNRVRVIKQNTYIYIYVHFIVTRVELHFFRDFVLYSSVTPRYVVTYLTPYYIPARGVHFRRHTIVHSVHNQSANVRTILWQPLQKHASYNERTVYAFGHHLGGSVG